jgi:hypothetical protein
MQISLSHPASAYNDIRKVCYDLCPHLCFPLYLLPQITPQPAFHLHPHRSEKYPPELRHHKGTSTGNASSVD